MNLEQLYKTFLTCTGVSIDTRTLVLGNMFFALEGGATSGSVYIEDALKKGAVVITQDAKFKLDKKTENIIIVEDVLKTLQDLATMHRKNFSIPIFALTGSNGKTTTKELVRDVLAKKYRVYATEGNLNNHIGVPLTILSIPKDAEIIVVEMGANHQGEIATLCEIAQPTHGLITNIGKAHIGEMGGIEGVTKTKGELAVYLKEHNGKFFLNKDDARLQILLARNMNIVAGTYGAADVGDYHTLLLGVHNKQNIAAARAVGIFFGVEEELIKKAISAYKPRAGRSEWLMWQGNKVLFDAYNANPSSMSIALQSFAELHEIKDDFKIAILGGMRELGTHQYMEHASILHQVEEYIVDEKLQIAYIVGPEFYEVYEKEIKKRGEANSKLLFFKDLAELKSFFDTYNFPSGKTVFLKASKGPGKEPMLKEVLSW